MSVGRIAAATAAACFVAFGAGGAAWAKAHPDDTLYAMYFSTPITVSVDVCGTVTNGSGCYGGAVISPPFEQVCAVLEGAPVYKNNRVTRMIYILDKRTSSSDSMLLYVYSRKDTVTANADTVTVNYQRRVFLGITGGASAQCHMAANPVLIYVGTDKSTSAVSMDKVNFTLLNIGHPNISSITADDRGYVSITDGSGFESFAPDGSPASAGGGRNDFVSTTNAWVMQH